MTFNDIAKSNISVANSEEKNILIKVVQRIDKDLNKSPNKDFLSALDEMLKKGTISKMDYDSIKENHKALSLCKRIIVNAIEEVEKETEVLKKDY